MSKFYEMALTFRPLIVTAGHNNYQTKYKATFSSFCNKLHLISNNVLTVPYYIFMAQIYTLKAHPTTHPFQAKDTIYELVSPKHYF